MANDESSRLTKHECAHGHKSLQIGCVSCALVWQRHDTATPTKERPPQFRLVLTRVATQGQFDVNQLEMVEGHDLVELLSKFLVVIARVQRAIEKENSFREVDDDIPF